MSKPDWKDTEQILSAMKPPHAPRDHESFWRTFQARAASLPRDEAAPAVTPAAGLRWRLMLGAAAACLVLAVIWLLPMPDNAAPHQLSTHVNTVQSLRITAPHSGFIVLKDEQSGGTIVWVTDMTQP